MSRAVIKHQPALGTPGGTFTSGAFRTRVLDDASYDPDSILALNANQMTIQPGSYFSRFNAGAFRVNSHQTRLWDVTHETELIIGSTEWSSSTAGAMITRSHGVGGFTVEEQTVLELQHRCSTTKVTNGFGLQASFTEEVYAQVELVKL